MEDWAEILDLSWDVQEDSDNILPFQSSAGVALDIDET